MFTAVAYNKVGFFDVYIYKYTLLKLIYVNTKGRCKPKNMTNFNQKVKILLKTLNFRYDTET